MIINLANEVKSGLRWERKELPDGHEHIFFDQQFKTIVSERAVTIKTRLRDMDDVFILLQTVDALRRVNKHVEINLFISYLLAARWDRPMSDWDSFDLKIVCDILNAANFTRITVVEPHSVASSLLLSDFEKWSPLDTVVQDYLKQWRQAVDSVCLVAPDLGAVKRVESFASTLSIDVPVVLCNKHRNLRTGEILSLDVLNVNAVRKNAVIYDDLCDGGRTFTEVAKSLRTAGAEHITLACTHGLFTKGINALTDFKEDGGYVDYILTTNSFQDFSEKHKQLNITQVI